MTGKMKATQETVLNENVRAAQADWLKLDHKLLREFIASQSDVKGPVENLAVSYPTSGTGISNGIAFLSANIDTGRGLESRELVVRYNPGRTLLKQKSFSDEFLTMKAIEAAHIPAPRVLWLDADGKRLGVKGYIMERIFGDIPAAGMFSQGLVADATPQQRKELMLDGASYHARLHRAAIGPEQVPHLINRGVGTTAIEQELRWWLQEATFNLAPNDDKLNRIHEAFSWLLAHQPQIRPPTLVHGDSQLSNLIYRDGRVIAALDWELAYLGHGEADLAMMIWLTRLQMVFDRDVQGAPTEAEFIARYEADSGAAIEHWSYMKMFQLFKLVSVLTASAETMPSFGTFWEHNWSELESVWRECSAEGVN